MNEQELEDEMRVCLEACGFKSHETEARSQTDQFMETQGLIDIRDLEHLDPKSDAKALIKSHNDMVTRREVKVGFLQQKNLSCLIYWVKDRVRRGIEIDGDEFDEDELKRVLSEMEFIDKKRDTTVEIQDPGKIETGLNWFEWEERLTNYLNSKLGVQDVPLDYVIRRDKPDDWDPEEANAYERLKYQAVLQGQAYDEDNKTVWQKIKDCAYSTAAKDWIVRFEGSQDGRGAIQALREHYEGTGEVKKRVQAAKAELSTLHYRDETKFSFEKFSSRLQYIFTVLDKHDEGYTESQKVDKMRELIRVSPNSNAEFAAAISNMRDNYSHDFDGAVSYLSLKVQQIYPQSHTLASGGRKRYISSVNSNSAVFNGVDCYYVSRRFTDEEWQRMGPDGQRFVNNKRQRLAASGRGGRGGGRGRGFGRGGGREQGRGRGRGRGGRGRGGQRDGGDNANNANNERTARQVTQEANEQQNSNAAQSVSTVTNSNDSNRGGNNGNRFGAGAHRGGRGNGNGSGQ